MIHFDLPKEKSSIIKVIGVGGGGSNAVNYMHSLGIEGVNFIICNTDAQAISQSKVPNKVQLGPHLTQGLGAGANPEIGRQATEESLEEVRRILEVNTKMAFITAGMGGGTGTGGAPIIARVCKEMGILTVGIITTPFSYEGKKRLQQGEEGIRKLKDCVDTLLIISNDKLRHQYGNLRMKEAFAKADNVLSTAAKCITDVINSTGQINVDFADVCTVMRNGGVAILGSAAVEGDNRAQRAIEQALNSPLLNDNDIRGAKWILININSCEGEHEFTMDEVDIIQNYLLTQAGENTDVIMGLGYDKSLGNKIGITLIATGFEHREEFLAERLAAAKAPAKEEKILVTLGMEGEERKIYNQSALFEEAAGPAMFPPDAPGNPSFGAPGFAAPVSEQVVVVAGPNAVAAGSADPEPAAEDPMAPKLVETPPAKPDFFITRVESARARGSRGFLSRPSHIYEEGAEEPARLDAKAGPEVKAAQPILEDTPMRWPLPEESTPGFEMRLIIRNEDTPAPRTEWTVQPDLRSGPSGPPDGGLASGVPSALASGQDLRSGLSGPPEETEEQRKRAADRLQKLRNLSFNVNSPDPAGEFESVPAYMRRNTELKNTVDSIENFYSSYTVKPAENNKVEISTINTFLDGKKPD